MNSERIRTSAAASAHAGHVTLAVGLGALAHLVVLAVCAVSPAGHTGDFHRYWTLATSEGRAYVDYAAEYPPGALAVFTALAWAVGQPARFDAALLLLNALMDAVILTVLATTWGPASAAVFLVLSVPILSLELFRMDLWSTAMATAAVALWIRKRPIGCALVLCMAAALKLWPLTLAGLLFPGSGRSWSRHALTTCLAVNAIALGVWIGLVGLGGVAQVVTFRGATGWDIESTVGSVWRAFAPGSMRMESGALRVGWNTHVTAMLLALVSGPLAVRYAWRGARIGQLGAGWVVSVATMLSCSALFSPQFLAWMLPGAAIAWAEEDRRVAVYVGTLVSLTVLYRVLHTQQMPSLVLLRNGLLIAGAVWIVPRRR